MQMKVFLLRENNLMFKYQNGRNFTEILDKTVDLHRNLIYNEIKHRR